MMQRLITWMILCWETVVLAQAQPVEMADAMHSNGKIYVVVLSMVLLFIGIAAYLLRLDIKVKQWEKK